MASSINNRTPVRTNRNNAASIPAAQAKTGQPKAIKIEKEDPRSKDSFDIGNGDASSFFATQRRARPLTEAQKRARAQQQRGRSASQRRPTRQPTRKPARRS